MYCDLIRSILPHLLMLSQGFLVHSSPSRFSSFRNFRISSGSVEVFLPQPAGATPVCLIFCGVQHNTPARCGGSSPQNLQVLSSSRSSCLRSSLLQSLLVPSSVRNCFSKLNFLVISSVGISARCALPVGSKSLALCALLLNPALSNLRCAPQAVLLT